MMLTVTYFVGDGQPAYRPAHNPLSLARTAVIAVANPLRARAAQEQPLAAAPATVNIYYGAGASAAIFTVQIAAGGYWEMPVPIYQGEVTAFGSAVAGHLIVTELQ